MHAFLLIGTSREKLEMKAESLAKNLHAKILEFPIIKIDDVRSLNNLIRLEFNEPTLIVCPDIHETGEEALNAFLKNLEEPQENIYFALTTPSTRKVLPTIVSRCEIIRIGGQESERGGLEIKKFLGFSVGEKLAYIDKIKDRSKAIEFAENMVNFLHRSLHENDVKYNSQADEIEIATKTLSGLKANGNVNLQLTNLVIKNGNK